MVAILKEDAKVLVPNSEHKNFTETNEVIPSGTKVTGDFKSIKGLRRGEPFSFRVFITENGQIIYSNKIKEMNTTEVVLGADASVTPTNINLVPAQAYRKTRVLATAIGLAGGYIYANKKGLKGKNAVKYAVIGGLLGYAAVWAFDKTKSVVITPSK